mmetsp:Transcript_17388/g.41196  ORF Transcript_17388/g.41196 Transcript_17388/m.41196 type:complete len:164 (+) Transcript_17388:101-592(+)
MVQGLTLALALLMAVTLQGCSDEAAVEQAREDAMKEGEALKGVQDAVGEYKEEQQKMVGARDNVQAKKDNFNKVLADEGRKPEGEEAQALADADKILKEQNAAEQAENAVEKGQKPDAKKKPEAKKGSSLLTKSQPRSNRQSRARVSGKAFLSLLEHDARPRR